MYLMETVETRERIVLNNFGVADARELAQVIRSEWPDVQITSGEEHALTPPEWVAIILTIDTWVHAIAPKVLKDLAHGAITGTGAFVATAALKQLQSFIPHTRKSNLTEKTDLQPLPASVIGRALDASPAKRLALHIISPDGGSVIVQRKRGQAWDATKTLAIACALAEAMDQGRINLSAIAGPGVYVLEFDRRGIRLVFRDESGGRASTPLKWTDKGLEQAPTRRGRRKG